MSARDSGGTKRGLAATQTTPIQSAPQSSEKAAMSGSVTPQIFTLTMASELARMARCAKPYSMRARKLTVNCEPAAMVPFGLKQTWVTFGS